MLDGIWRGKAARKDEKARKWFHVNKRWVVVASKYRKPVYQRQHLILNNRAHRNPAYRSHCCCWLAIPVHIDADAIVCPSHCVRTKPFSRSSLRFVLHLSTYLPVEPSMSPSRKLTAQVFGTELNKRLSGLVWALSVANCTCLSVES